MTKKERYKTDTEFRVKRLSQTKRYHENNLKYKVYRDLVKVRKAVYQQREYIEARLAKAARMERVLIQLVKKQAILSQKWRDLRLSLGRSR